MMKILNKSIKFIITIAVIIALFSCNKENTLLISDGQALVKINLIGTESMEELPLKSTSSNRTGLKVVSTQVVRVPYNDEYTIEAALTVDNSNTASLPENGSIIQSTNNSISQKAVAVALPNYSKYRIIVYDNTGKYVDQIVYTMGSETGQELKLDAGKTYTFVCISYGSTSVVSPISTTSTLAQAKYIGISTTDNDLMYTTVSRTLVAGNNDLNLILKHKFSQITTTIDASAIGSISAIGNAQLHPHYGSIDLNLSDGLVNFQSATLNSKILTFPNQTGTSIVANPIIIAAPTGSGIDNKLTIGSITIGGVVRTNLPEVTGFNIKQGERYSLKVTLKKYPTSIEVDNIVWATGNLVYNAPNSYSIAPYGQLGNYFPYNKLTPAPLLAFTSNTNGDPCAKLTIDAQNNPNSKPWRMPTFQEIGVFTLDNPPTHAFNDRFTIVEINGNRGIKRIGQDLFFPYSNGSYEPTGNEPTTQGSMGNLTNSLYWVGSSNSWSSTKSSTTTPGPYGTWTYAQAFNYQRGMQIRCVRDK